MSFWQKHGVFLLLCHSKRTVSSQGQQGKGTAFSLVAFSTVDLLKNAQVHKYVRLYMYAGINP